MYNVTLIEKLNNQIMYNFFYKYIINNKEISKKK